MVSSQRYGDGFMFMCEYARSNRVKCKACRNNINKNHLKIGTRGLGYDHWDDSLWFHYRCFWTKCFYRKHVVKLNPNDPDIVGYSELKENDKERVRKSVAKLQEHLKAKEEVAGQPEDEASSSRSGPELVTIDWRKHQSKAKQNDAPDKGDNGEKLQFKVGTTMCIEVYKENGVMKIGFKRVSDIEKDQETCDKSLYLSHQEWQKLMTGETTDRINNAIVQLETVAKSDETEEEPKRKKMKQELKDTDESNSFMVDLLPDKIQINVTLKSLDDVKQVFVTIEKQSDKNKGGKEKFKMTKQEWEGLEKIKCDVNKDLERLVTGKD